MNRPDLGTFLYDLAEVRDKVACLTRLGIDLGDIQTGYEVVIDDLLEIAGMTERQIDLLWELTEPKEVK